ncbi:MAG: hypothetical protein ACI9PP_001378, partial [Halobacteriales archaeon]
QGHGRRNYLQLTDIYRRRMPAEYNTTDLKHIVHKSVMTIRK